MYRPVTKWNALVNRWDRIPELVSMAAKQSLSGRPGPTHLDIPVDILFETQELDSVSLIPPAKSRAFGRPQGDPVAIEKAAEMLVKADRPLLHTGSGVYRSEAWQEIRELAEYLDMPVVPTAFGRGVIPETHRLGLRPAQDAARFAGQNAQVILAVCCTFSELDNWGKPDMWGSPDVQKVIQVDIDPTQIALNREVDLGIVGDAKAVLAQLLEAVKSLTNKVEARKFADDAAALEKKVRETIEAAIRDDSDPIHPARVVREASDFFGGDAIVCLDGGNFGLWGGMVTVNQPRSLLFPVGSGHLGAGLPFALAAKMAFPDRPVYIIHGDGAFMFSSSELETAARLNLPIVDIVGNDGAYSMLKGAQDFAFGGRHCGVDFMRSRYDLMAQDLGWFGKQVSKPSEMRPALEEAAASGKPALLNVMIDCEVNLWPPVLEGLIHIWLGGCEGC
jgi:acetolactate synthase I/II/III large subunit